MASLAPESSDDAVALLESVLSDIQCPHSAARCTRIQEQRDVRAFWTLLRRLGERHPGVTHSHCVLVLRLNAMARGAIYDGDHSTALRLLDTAESLTFAGSKLPHALTLRIATYNTLAVCHHSLAQNKLALRFLLAAVEIGKQLQRSGNRPHQLGGADSEASRTHVLRRVGSKLTPTKLRSHPLTGAKYLHILARTHLQLHASFARSGRLDLAQMHAQLAVAHAAAPQTLPLSAAYEAVVQWGYKSEASPSMDSMHAEHGVSAFSARVDGKNDARTRPAATAVVRASAGLTLAVAYLCAGEARIYTDGHTHHNAADCSANGTSIDTDLIAEGERLIRTGFSVAAAQSKLLSTSAQRARASDVARLIQQRHNTVQTLMPQQATSISSFNISENCGGCGETSTSAQDFSAAWPADPVVVAQDIGLDDSAHAQSLKFVPPEEGVAEGIGQARPTVFELRNAGFGRLADQHDSQNQRPIRNSSPPASVSVSVATSPSGAPLAEVSLGPSVVPFQLGDAGSTASEHIEVGFAVDSQRAAQLRSDTATRVTRIWWRAMTQWAQLVTARAWRKWHVLVLQRRAFDASRAQERATRRTQAQAIKRIVLNWSRQNAGAAWRQWNTVVKDAHREYRLAQNRARDLAEQRLQQREQQLRNDCARAQKERDDGARQAAMQLRETAMRLVASAVRHWQKRELGRAWNVWSRLLQPIRKEQDSDREVRQLNEQRLLNDCARAQRERDDGARQAGAKLRETALRLMASAVRHWQKRELGRGFGRWSRQAAIVSRKRNSEQKHQAKPRLLPPTVAQTQTLPQSREVQKQIPAGDATRRGIVNHAVQLAESAVVAQATFRSFKIRQQTRRRHFAAIMSKHEAARAIQALVRRYLSTHKWICLQTARVEAVLSIQDAWREHLLRNGWVFKGGRCQAPLQLRHSLWLQNMRRRTAPVSPALVDYSSQAGEQPSFAPRSKEHEQSRSKKVQFQDDGDGDGDGGLQL